MTQVASRGAARQKRHNRIRLTLAGTEARPRLAVFRSLNHIYAQVIDDASGRTLAAASTVEKELKGSSSTKTEEAAVVGRLLAERAKAAGIERGDLIVAAKGKPVERVDALYEALDSLAEGDTLELRVLRGTEERDVPVTFDAQAEAVR